MRSFADKLFLNIILIIIIVAIAILIYISILDTLTKRRSRISIKNDKSKILKFIQNMFAKIIPSENSFKYKKIYLKLKETGLHINVKQFYIFKVITPLLVISLFTPIVYHNYISKNYNIIKKVDIHREEILLDDNLEESTEEYKNKKELKNEKYFQLIKQNINLKDIKKFDKTKEISKLFQEKLNLTKQDSIIEAKNMQNKIREMKGEKDFALVILIIFMISYKLMDFILYIFHKYKSINRESEKILICRLVFGLGKITNIKAYEIIIKLSEITNIYKYLFQECLEEYENGNHVEALKNIKEKTEDQDIIEIIDLFIIANQTETINNIIDDFEINYNQKNGNRQIVDNIRTEKIIGKSQLLVSTSLFVVILCLSLPLLGIFEMLNF